MPKIYDIEEFLNDKEFTYQLYADMEVAATGTSDVQVAFTQDTETLIVSFDVSGAVGPYTNLNLVVGEDNPPSILPTSVAYIAFIVPPGTNPNIWAVSTGAGNINPTGDANGSYRIVYEGNVLKVYLNDVLQGTMALAPVVPANLLYSDLFLEGAGTITNVVLGP